MSTPIAGCDRMYTEIGFCSATLDYVLAVLQIPVMLGAIKSLARTMEDQEMKGNDILDLCRRLNQITDELAAMVDEELSVVRTATLTLMPRTVACSG
jgi:hypothetical protein